MAGDNFVVGVRLNAETHGLRAELNLSQAELDQLKGSAKRSGDAMRTHAASVNSAEMQHRRIVASGRQAVSMFKSMAVTMGTVATTLALVKIGQLADDWTSLSTRMRTATKDTNDFNTVWAETRDIAFRTRTPLEANVALFQGMARVKDDLGATNKELLRVTEAVGGLGRIGGSTTEQMSNGMLQFTQLLGGGVVQAEELNSLLDSMPELVNRIAGGMGKTASEFRKVVKTGTVLSTEVFESLKKQVDEINEEVAELDSTMSAAITNLATATMERIGVIDESLNLQKAAVLLIDTATSLIRPDSKVAQALARDAELVQKLADATNNLAIAERKRDAAGDRGKQFNADRVAMYNKEVREAATALRDHSIVLTENAQRANANEAAQKRHATALKEGGKWSADQAKQLDRLISKLDPAAEETKRLAAAEELFAEAIKFGELSTERVIELRALLATTTKEYADEVKAAADEEERLFSFMQAMSDEDETWRKDRNDRKLALEEEHDKRVKIIQDLQLEVDLLGLSAKERYIETETRKLGANATQQQIDKVVELAGKLADTRLQEDFIATAWEKAAERIDASFFQVFRAGFEDMDALVVALDESLKGLAAEVAYGAFKNALLGDGATPFSFGGTELTTGQQVGLGVGLAGGTAAGSAAGGGGQYASLGSAGGAIAGAGAAAYLGAAFIAANPVAGAVLLAAAGIAGGSAGGLFGGVFDDGEANPQIKVQGGEAGFLGPTRGNVGSRGTVDTGAFGSVYVGGHDKQPRTQAMQTLASRLVGLDNVIAEYLDPSQIASAGAAANAAVAQTTSAGNFDPASVAMARVSGVFGATESTLGSIFQTISDVDPANLETALGSAIQLTDFIGEDMSQSFEDMAETIARASDSLYEGSIRAGQSLLDLARNYDGTTESAEKLAKATFERSAAEAALTAQIASVRSGIKAGSDSLRERMLRDTETDAQTSNRLFGQAQEDIRLLNTLEDPAQIAKVAARVQENLGTVWGTLSPEEKAARKSEFDAFLDTVDDISGGQLDATLATIKQQGKEIRDAVAEALLQPAADMASTASAMATATATLERAAAAIPDDINVYVESAET